MQAQQTYVVEAVAAGLTGPVTLEPPEVRV
jgi:hypothetical protein